MEAVPARQNVEMAVQEYEAMIGEVGSDKWTQRATIFASSLAEAREKLEAEYGAGTVFDLRNCSDANKPR